VRSYTRLLAGLAAGDPRGQVTAAWIATQELRHVYGAHDLAQARDRLFTFYLGFRNFDNYRLRLLRASGRAKRPG